MGRIGNSLSHLMLGLSSSLESVPLDQSTQGLLDTSLQAFAQMTRELGRTLSTLVHARRQVWLVQSPLTEPCRKMLRALPVVPGELDSVHSHGSLRCEACLEAGKGKPEGGAGKRGKSLQERRGGVDSTHGNREEGFGMTLPRTIGGTSWNFCNGDGGTSRTVEEGWMLASSRPGC
ncbi:hypothetical protein GOODEAATRI_009429 [Goodea atripinnis]|uniref:Uncharacterized protein n=1 Tax=Goodea atripinnis TaxID=208336 RepID=A0ABV0MRY9_9TELE